MIAARGLTLEETALRARRVRFVLSDNDGVMTDATVWYSERGEELKRYSLRDGMGVERLRNVGIETVLITREVTGAAAARAKKLKIRAYRGVQDKDHALRDILKDLAASLDELAFIGDDVNDLAIMQRIGEIGLTGAPADAFATVLAVAHYHAVHDGGRGAFRDFAEWLIAHRG